MDQVEPRAIMDALDGTGVAASHETVEKSVAFGALSDAGESGVLPRDADAGVPHDELQEPRLTLGEAVLDDGLDAGKRSRAVARRAKAASQRNNSSMMLGDRPARPPRPPPVLQVMLRLMPP